VAFVTLIGIIIGSAGKFPIKGLPREPDVYVDRFVMFGFGRLVSRPGS